MMAGLPQLVKYAHAHVFGVGGEYNHRTHTLVPFTRFDP